MIRAGPYEHDKKARLHEALPSLAEEIGSRSGKKNIILDSYIISSTPYDDLREKYDDGKWNWEKFTKAHILFPERNSVYE